MSSRINRQAIKSFTLTTQEQTSAGETGAYGYIRDGQASGIQGGAGEMRYAFSSRLDNNAGTLEMYVDSADELRVSHNNGATAGHQWGIQQRIDPDFGDNKFYPADQVTVVVDAQAPVVALWNAGTQRYELAASGLLAYLITVEGVEAAAVLTFGIQPPP